MALLRSECEKGIDGQRDGEPGEGGGRKPSSRPGSNTGRVPHNTSGVANVPVIQTSNLADLETIPHQGN